MTRRTYRSALRSEQAADTRRRILEAAGTCFAADGYGRTTLTRIAKEAGVSVESVKLQGPKRDLLLAAFEQSFAGQEGPVPLIDQEALMAVRAIADHDQFLDAALEFIAAANRRARALWLALRSAADADAAVEPVLHGLLARRREDIEGAVAVLQQRGLVPAGRVQCRRVAAEVSFLLSPEGYQQLVIESGWSHRHYLAWIRTMVRTVVSDAEERG